MSSSCRNAPSLHGRSNDTASIAATAGTSAGCMGRSANAPAVSDAVTSAATRSPAQQRSRPREAGAERGQADEAAVAHATVVHRSTERERNRGRGRVAVAIDVVDDLRLVEPEVGGDELVDAQVRLVRDQQVEVREAEAVELERLADHLGEARHRVLEDELALHARERGGAVALEVLRTDARTLAARGRLEPELLGELALGVQVRREDALLRVARRSEHHGRGTVA